jgi:HJR/Mrr/RecB family endonuclease
MPFEELNIRSIELLLQNRQGIRAQTSSQRLRNMQKIDKRQMQEIETNTVGVRRREAGKIDK